MTLRVPRLTLRTRDKLSGYSFVAPQFAGFSVFVLGPIGAVVWFSLHDWNIVAGNFNRIWLDNYQAILDDALIDTVALNSIAFTVGYVPLNVLSRLILALAVNRAMAGMWLFRTLYFTPVVVSLVAWTIVWRFMLAGDGVLNGLLRAVGVEGPNWLRDPTLAMLSVVLVQVLKNAGLSMILFLAALQGIPADLVDAARVDGAGRWQLFRHVTLPLITPFVFLVTVLAVISALKSFSLIFLTTRGGPGDATLVLAYYIYEVAFHALEMGYASALAVVLFLVVLAFTTTQFVVRKRWVFYEE